MNGSKNIEEKKLAQWLYHQKKDYKDKKGGMKNEKRYTTWTQFIEEYKEYFLSDDEVWYITFEKLKEFINLKTC